MTASHGAASPSTERVGLHLFTGQGPKRDVVAAVLRHADLAFASGFDLVSFGEHHANTPGYLPESWAVAAAVLAVDPTRSVGVYPYLAGLRAPAMAVETVELVAALHPGRITVAIAPGYAARDFEIAGVTLADSRRNGALVLDALAACGQSLGCDLLVAGAGPLAIRSAVEHGAGLLLPPLSANDEADLLARSTELGIRGRIVAQRWVAVDDSDLSLYAALSSPYAPTPQRYRSAAEFAAMLDATFDAGVTEVSVRVGGPQHADAIDRAEVIDLLEEGCRLWRQQSRAVTR